MNSWIACWPSQQLAGWDGLGVAVQAYSKRAADVLRYLGGRADETGRVLNVRLVKGAYWDSEVKRAQERGLPGYPVYTRKQNTDVGYLACARILLDGSRRLYPQFATHNAHTVASIIHLAKVRGREFEFQRLHGMGEELYEEVTDPAARALAMPRLCAGRLARGPAALSGSPVAGERLEHLVRQSHRGRVAAARARSSATRSRKSRRTGPGPHPRIPLPVALFGSERANSAGVNLADGREQQRLADACTQALKAPLAAAPIVGGRKHRGPQRKITCPANLERIAGEVAEADVALVETRDRARRSSPARMGSQASR